MRSRAAVFDIGRGGISPPGMSCLPLPLGGATPRKSASLNARTTWVSPGSVHSASPANSCVVPNWSSPSITNVCSPTA